MPAAGTRDHAPASSRGTVWQEITNRLLAATVGGYLLASAAAALLATTLPLSASERVIGATLPAFAIHVGAVMLAFGTRKVRTAWAWLLLPTALMAAAAYLSGPAG